MTYNMINYNDEYVNYKYKIIYGGEENIQPTDQSINPGDQSTINPSDQSSDKTLNTQDKLMSIVSTINKKYTDFKKSLYDFAKEQNLTEEELIILLPTNDEPFVDESNIDNLIFKKLSSKSIYVGKNGHITDGQTPFYNPTLKINS
jgi:hypothetical protein